MKTVWLVLWSRLWSNSIVLLLRQGHFSSRKIERTTYELTPVLFITGGMHPDHDNINTFRKRFLGALSDLFVKLLQIAHGMGVLKLGDISMDGTKIKANVFVMASYLNLFCESTVNL